MKRKKSLDCVQMKWDIQQQIDKEYKNIPDEEAYKIQTEKVRNNPILGPIFKKIISIQRKTTKPIIKIKTSQSQEK